MNKKNGQAEACPLIGLNRYRYEVNLGDFVPENDYVQIIDIDRAFYQLFAPGFRPLRHFLHKVIEWDNSGEFLMKQTKFLEV